MAMAMPVLVGFCAEHNSEVSEIIARIVADSIKQKWFHLHEVLLDRRHRYSGAKRINSFVFFVEYIEDCVKLCNLHQVVNALG